MGFQAPRPRMGMDVGRPVNFVGRLQVVMALEQMRGGIARVIINLCPRTDVAVQQNGRINRPFTFIMQS